MKFRGIMIRVYDIERSLDFYQNVLGLEILRTRDEIKGAKLFYMGINDSSPYLTLCYNFHHPEKYTHGSHFGHIAYEIESMKEFEEHIESLGISFDRLPFDTKNGFRLAFIKDPDGVMIELVEDLNK